MPSPPGDQRVTEVSPTSAGRDALSSAAPGHVELVRRVFLDGLAPDVVRQLAESLETAYDNVASRDSAICYVIPEREGEQLRAITITGYGPPSVLQVADVEIGPPAARQIQVAVTFAGVGPTDLAIRAGHLDAVYPVRPGGILGFEAVGVVEAVGDQVDDVAAGDDVAVFLPGSLGGYAERVNADFWVRRPANVPWTAAAALPASGEAAVRVLAQLRLQKSETLLVLGGNGSVGAIATQLAVALGATVVSAVRPSDFAEVAARGAVPIDYQRPLRDTVPSAVDAVLDASGRTDLAAAVAVAGGPARVISLSDPRAAQFGVTLSSLVPAGVPAALREAMDRVADGTLSLSAPAVVPLERAADVHAGLENGTLRGKVVLRL